PVTLSTKVFGKTFSIDVGVPVHVEDFQNPLQTLWNNINDAGKKAGNDIAQEGKRGAETVKRVVTDVIDFIVDAVVPDFVEDTVRNFANGLQKLTAALPQLPQLFTFDFNSNVSITGLPEVFSREEVLRGLSLQELLGDKIRSLVPTSVNDIAGMISSSAQNF